MELMGICFNCDFFGTSECQGIRDGREIASNSLICPNASFLIPEEEFCGECEFFTGEECDGCLNEGSEMYEDSKACEEFIPREG